MQRAAASSRQLLLEVTMHTKEEAKDAGQKMQADTVTEQVPVESVEQTPVDEGKAAGAKKKRVRASKKGGAKPAPRTGPRPMRRLGEDVIRARRVEFKRRLAKHQRLCVSAEKLIGKYEHELVCRGLAPDADADTDTMDAEGEAPADAEAASGAAAAETEAK
eukprot:3754824-Rhodomonas_salina.1